jgi:hypothetical protein
MQVRAMIWQGTSALFALTLLVAGTARADVLHAVSSKGGPDDSVNVTENADGTISVQAFDPSGNDITASNVTIISSGVDSIHFTYASTDASYVGQSSADMLEPDGITLSDRILATANPDGSIDFQFQSDAISLPQVNPFPSQIETGGLQNMYPGLPDAFNFSSPAAPVPEPASLCMACVAMIFGGGAAGLRRLRRKG